jgi:hypothetical protein
MSDVVTSDSPSDPADRVSAGGGGKRALVVGGVIGALAVGGGAVWAATSFFGQGAQPAEALPAGTIGYVSVDLDPSGGQKVAAIEMLRKFPAFKEEIGLETDDDIRERIFTEIVESGECPDLDYAADVEPWLGQRAAVAAVDAGEEMPVPVVVVQVNDAGAAENGLATLTEKCGGEPIGSSVEGDWAVLAETQDQVDTVVEQTGEGTLAADGDYQRWIDEAGDPGVMTMYAAPEAGQYIVDAFGTFGPAGVSVSSDGDRTSSDEVPDELEAQLEDFQGGAATIRFAEGSLEMELAVDAGKQAAALAGDGSGGEVIGSLPADTAAALAVSLPEGWMDLALEQAATASGGEMTPEDLAGEMESTLGLTPDDIETALGESFALALGADFSVDEAMASSGPESLPVGLKVKGDADEIEGVLDQVRSSMGAEMGTLLDSEADGDYVVVGPNADYRDALAGDGGLADTDEFQGVVDDAEEANSVFFVNFNGDWLGELADASGDPRVAENLEPLAAFGASGEIDDEVSHGIIRLTTD